MQYTISKHNIQFCSVKKLHIIKFPVHEQLYIFLMRPLKL